MGRDKAWLDLGGRPMIEHIMDALKPVAQSLNIIANSPEYLKLGVPVFADQWQGIGPLEAIRTALVNAETDSVILVGCDMPFVTTELFSLLSRLSEGYPATVPVSREGRFEPLCAIYSTAALPSVEALIQTENYKVSLLLDRITARLVRFDEYKELNGSVRFFKNVNTPEDYERALEFLK